jgi:hypothetical protein
MDNQTPNEQALLKRKVELLKDIAFHLHELDSYCEQFYELAKDPLIQDIRDRTDYSMDTLRELVNTRYRDQLDHINI